MCFFISAAKVQLIALNISMKNMYVNNSGSYDFDTVYTNMTFKDLKICKFDQTQGYDSI